MRLFIAIELPEHARDHLVRAAHALLEPALRLARPENLHCTIKFLGDVKDAAVPALCEALSDIEVEDAIFAHSGACLLLPSLRHARIVAVRLEEETPGLAKLQQTVEDVCAEAGFLREPRREFVPHVTLARTKLPLRPAAAAECARCIDQTMPGPGFSVTELILFQSELTQRGPVYSVVARFGV